MKALRRLTVRATFPAELAKLATIVNNLRWSWHPDSRDLLESVDPDLWRACGGDPGRMLGMLLRGPAEGKVRDFLLGNAADGLKKQAEA